MSDVPTRWTKAGQFADMWVDPGDDPRESDHHPDGELETAQDFLRGYRLTLLMKCDDLTPEQLSLTSVPPSGMSLLGLLRHLAEVERDWRGWFTGREPEPRLYGPRGADFDGAGADPALVDEAFANLEAEQNATDAVFAAHPDMAERAARDGSSMRELWAHRVEEYARHCGHADLLRERIDGRVGQ